MDRICPNCHVKLGSYDHYFCTECGYVLPTELISTQGVFKHVANFSVSSNETLKKKAEKPISRFDLKPFVNLRMLGISVIGLVLFILVLLYIKEPILDFVNSRSHSLPKPTVPQINLTTKKPKSIVKSPLDWASGNFEQDNLYTSVPYDADIVIEGHDLTNFSAFYKGIDPAYSDLVNEYTGKVKNDFVFFAHKENNEYHWTLVFEPVDKSFVVAPDMFKKYPWLKFWKSDPIAVFATHSDVIQAIQDSKTNVSKNFTHTTLFAASKQSIPNEEKLVFFIKNESARAYFKNLAESLQVPTEMKTLMEDVVNSQTDYSVVL